MTYTANTQELRDSASALFERVLAGDIRSEVNQRFAPTEAADAHRAPEARETTGSSILIA
jgi:NADPH:quinone reductase